MNEKTRAAVDGRVVARPIRAHPHLSNINVTGSTQIGLRLVSRNPNGRTRVARTVRRAICYLVLTRIWLL